MPRPPGDLDAYLVRPRNVDVAGCETAWGSVVSDADPGL